MNLYPLTEVEQEMAEQYIDRVDQFLRRKRLDPSEYYDVAIFGYLAAIQRECRNPNQPRNANLYGLMEVCMNRAVLQEWNRQHKVKRRGDWESLSLDCTPAHTDEGEFSLYEIVADTRQNTAVQVEARDLTERVLAVASPREREAIDLVCLGYEPHEIADLLGITRNTTYRALCNFREKARAVRDDREVIRTPKWTRDNKEKVLARNRAWWQAHRLELNAKARIRERAYRAAHREEINARKRAWRAAHKEEVNARDRARRAAKRAAERAKVQEERRPQCCEHQERQIAAVC